MIVVPPRRSSEELTSKRAAVIAVALALLIGLVVATATGGQVFALVFLFPVGMLLYRFAKFRKKQVANPEPSTPSINNKPIEPK